MKYTVEINSNKYIDGLIKTAAIKMAKREAANGNDVIVSWFRQSDGQHGYLNPDGNHAITGKYWRR